MTDPDRYAEVWRAIRGWVVSAKPRLVVAPESSEDLAREVQNRALAVESALRDLEAKAVQEWEQTKCGGVTTANTGPCYAPVRATGIDLPCMLPQGHEGGHEP